MRYRVSPTLLDAYRLYSDPNIDWKPESELIASIKRETVSTPRMRVVKSGHCAMEGANPGHVQPDGFHACDGFKWSPETVGQCLSAIPPGGVHEVKVEKWITVNRQQVQLVGVTDYLFGTTSFEFKFPLDKYGIDVDYYTNSIQWKVYCVLFRPSCVKYVVFNSRLDEASGEVTVHDHHELALSPYENVESDVIELTDRFLTYARWRNLLPYLAAKEAA